MINSKKKVIKLTKEEMMDLIPVMDDDFIYTEYYEELLEEDDSEFEFFILKDEND